MWAVFSAMWNNKPKWTFRDTMRAKLMGQLDIKSQQVYTGADIEIMRKAIEGKDQIKAVA
tara:strand:+ start:503 stop:682 length:180 start_codon:yes stop_codon:yes gene_type:complete